MLSQGLGAHTQGRPRLGLGSREAGWSEEGTGRGPVIEVALGRHQPHRQAVRPGVAVRSAAQSLAPTCPEGPGFCLWLCRSAEAAACVLLLVRLGLRCLQGPLFSWTVENASHRSVQTTNKRALQSQHKSLHIPTSWAQALLGCVFFYFLKFFNF